MTNQESWAELLKPCECAAQYTIELHGDGYALYYGRCGHRHGWNLINMIEPAWNFEPKHIEKLLNLGAAEYAKNPDEGSLRGIEKLSKERQMILDNLNKGDN